MISEAIKLINGYEEYEKDEYSNRIVVSENFPENLAFLDLASIYLFESNCELLLQNGVGKDIGYNISKGKNDQWIIKYFDHYKSWESNQINLND